MDIKLMFEIAGGIILSGVLLSLIALFIVFVLIPGCVIVFEMCKLFGKTALKWSLILAVAASVIFLVYSLVANAYDEAIAGIVLILIFCGSLVALTTRKAIQTWKLTHN